MNKEIKYRVYDKDNKKMRYLSNSHDSIWFDENGSAYYENMQTGLGDWFSDLMQYTGLKDGNGSEIYEGDILREYSNDITDWVVSFSYGKYIGTFDNVEEDLYELSDLEVIGNIYEFGDSNE